MEISIIVPIFNVEQYLRRCLDSILKQTYKDYEVLLIDDGSTDKSGIIAREFTNDKRFVYFYKENGGIGSVRNYGLERAKGNYICFIDSDDYVDPEYLDSLLSKMHDVDMSMCYYYLQNEDGTVILPNKMISQALNANDIWSINEINIKMIDVPWNKMYKKELFENIRYPNIIIHEDSLTIEKVLLKCKDVYIVGKPLYHYCQRPGSLISISRDSIDLCLFDSYLSRITFFKIINRMDLCLEMYLSLICRLSVIRTDRHLYDRNKKDVDSFIVKSKNVGKGFVFQSISIKHKIAILLYISSPYLFGYVYKKSFNKK